MRSRTRLGFALTVASTVLIFFGWVIPFWFGRFYGDNSKTQWSLFYRIQCVRGRCETIGDILSKAIVNFEGAESRIELEAVAILATLAMSLCILGFVIVLLFHCSVRGKSFSYFNYIMGAAVVQFTAALFVFLTIVIGGIAVGDFFSLRKIDSVIEFPWSILFYSVGLVLLIAAAIIFTLIVINWRDYRSIYARKRYYLNNTNVDLYTPEDKLDRSFSGSSRHERHIHFERPYGVDNSGYSGMSGSLRNSHYGKRERLVGFANHPRNDPRYDPRNDPRYDPRNDRQYSTLPARGSRRHESYRETSGRYSPYSMGERYPSGRHWHSVLNDVMRESEKLRMASYRYGDSYM